VLISESIVGEGDLLLGYRSKGLLSVKRNELGVILALTVIYDSHHRWQRFRSIIHKPRDNLYYISKVMSIVPLSLHYFFKSSGVTPGSNISSFI